MIGSPKADNSSSDDESSSEEGKKKKNAFSKLKEILDKDKDKDKKEKTGRPIVKKGKVTPAVAPPHAQTCKRVAQSIGSLF